MKENMTDNCTLQENETSMEKLIAERKWEIVWLNVFFVVSTNTMALYGLYLCFTKAMWSTISFAYFLTILSNIGVAAGAHRLWTHRAYKAKLPLQIINLIFFTLAYEGTVYQWGRDHRAHHKFVETDADPHNATRGFFFAHIGWLMLKKHPEISRKRHLVDMSDIENDPLLKYHRKTYYVWVLLFSVILPMYIPILWGEDLGTSFFVAVILRHVVAIHGIFCVNSVAHLWGTKPYDKNIYPVENKFVSFFAAGEGFHNYHHTFPWDYRDAEMGGYGFNFSWLFIDLMAKIGWAYDLKTVSEELIQKRVLRTGDGTHPIWGWNDKDLPEEYKQSAKILY